MDAKYWIEHEPQKARCGKKVWIIDIPYTWNDPKTGRAEKRRYRKDAKVQSQGAAEAELRRHLMTLATQGFIPIDDDAAEAAKRENEWTFKEAVDYWRKHTSRRHSTVHSYNINLNAYLLPMFGKRPISSIGYEDVTILRTKLREREIRTANNVEVALRAVLRFSKANKRLASFPELPALRKGPDRLLTLPNVEDVHLALGAAYAEARLALALAAFAGLRAGEILGLRFADVDLAARQLTVRQAIFRGVEGPPKSGSGRKIPIAESLREVLVVAFQRPHEPGDRVCVSTRGEPWASDGSLRSAFAAVLKKVDLPPARVHDLRHFFVTQCFRSGASAPDIQAFVGHRDLRVTQGYAHTDEDSQNDAMQKFEARLLSGRASRGNSVETAPHEAGSAAEASDEKANKSSGEERVCH